jgi:HEAT repeat protein
VAVRAALARRLRTAPVEEVLEQAQLLLSDDAEGVVHVLAELRRPEITRYLLELASQADLPVNVRAGAAEAVDASEPWVRDTLAKLIAGDGEEAVRAAAMRSLGAFVSVGELFRAAEALAAARSPSLRGAFLWALQLAGRPGKLETAEAERATKALERMLGDEDPAVRRRAAYVAGNLRLGALAGALASLAKAESKRADLRVAAFTGLAELASAAVLGDVVALARKEEDPQALAAASRAIAQIALVQPDAKPRLEPLHAKAARMLQSKDAVVRRAGARLAGLSGGAVPASALAPLAADEAPRVREEAFAALARVGGAAAEQPLLAAFDDPDAAMHERAAEALLVLGGEKALLRLLMFVSGEANGGARAAIAARLEVPPALAPRIAGPLDEALQRIDGDDAAYEPLLELKVKLLEQGHGERAAGNVEAAIAAAFPTYTRLSKVRGFEQLGRSLRTAEALYGTATGLADADMSPPIVLWMKCMEGYAHTLLAGRLQALQRDSMMLFDHVDRLLLESWPAYQGFVSQRWKDSVDVGQAHVEIPLRSLSNSLREFQERRRKRLDSPLSVTEWARMIVFLGVDHPAGVRNLLKLSNKSADQVVRLAHRLHTLAAVRNLVTHRAAAGALTLEAFRKVYYAAFDDLIKLA